MGYLKEQLIFEQKELEKNINELIEYNNSLKEMINQSETPPKSIDNRTADIVLKFLKSCQFNFDKGRIYFSTMAENFTKFKEENGVGFFILWDFLTIEEKDKLMQKCFM